MRAVTTIGRRLLAQLEIVEINVSPLVVSGDGPPIAMDALTVLD